MMYKMRNNQINKENVWGFWQKMNHATPEQVPDIIKDAFCEDVDWNGSTPINQIVGVEALITDFWQPLLTSFPDLKRNAYIFLGGYDEGFGNLSRAEEVEEWVSGCGYLTGTFHQDWLGIPATGKKTNIFFGQFYRMQEGKIAENYVVFDILSVIRQAGFQVMPPALGMEGGKIPAPYARDGVLLIEQDELESRKTLQLVESAMSGLGRYVRDRDGGNMDSMEEWHNWHPHMKWYGLSGIGCCFDMEEFQDFHQRPWLHGFGDRGMESDGGGRMMGFVGEGLYAIGGIWDGVFSYNHGDYAGIPATGKLMTMRDFDWWKREGDLIIENWCSIDLIDLLAQLGVNLFERLEAQVEMKKRGELWFVK